MPSLRPSCRSQRRGRPECNAARRLRGLGAHAATGPCVEAIGDDICNAEIPDIGRYTNPCLYWRVGMATAPQQTDNGRARDGNPRLVQISRSARFSESDRHTVAGAAPLKPPHSIPKLADLGGVHRTGPGLFEAERPRFPGRAVSRKVSAAMLTRNGMYRTTAPIMR